jgi:hypothetical protein
VAGVLLVFRDVSEDRRLGQLEDRDARMLAQALLAGPSLAGSRLSGEFTTAADRGDSDPSVTVLLQNDDELAVVYEACVESLVLKGMPTIKQLCAEIARVRARR